ncbi:MAG: purine-nucleoside phosphorylase [Candidatus Gastranaerophilales bacterium]|nr:purine-nucleoside phosphorylase [Candidatus Gastranaerophilales bacterium]
MQQIQATLDFLNSKTNFFTPEVAIVLGSGLGSFCDNLEGISVKYNEIPHFGSLNVDGHKGELLFCEIFNKKCVIMQGRFHFYEGNSLQVATYPIKVFKKMGVKTLILTNAAGATRNDFNVGDIMLINDHINFMGDNPLIGKNDSSLGERFPDMSEVYDEFLRDIAKNSAKELDIDLKEGVYLAVSGPSYETKAEVKMYHMLGADVVGMSTVPEAIVANYLKMNVLAFSMVTNLATGVGEAKLSHQEVLDCGKFAGGKLSSLLMKILERI